MATVTVIIRLRRRIEGSEGRNPVDIEDLTAALIEELESSVLDTEFAVTDSAGDDTTYEVTALRPARRDEPAIADAEPMNSCAVCGTAIVSDPHGRPRLYCSDACRQAAHRARRPAH
jgi:predicted nucleic acid-binding Zn ribbon protein